LATLEKKAGIQSVRKAFEILEAIASNDSLKLTEIVKLTGLKRTLAHAYLISLQQVGIITQDENTLRFRLGGTAVRFGLKAVSTQDFQATANRFMSELREKVGHSVLLSVWSSQGPVTISRVEGRYPSPFEIRIGTLVNLTDTSAGLVFLAYLDRSAWSHLLTAKNLNESHHFNSFAELHEAVAGVKKRGIASLKGLIGPNETPLNEFAAMSAPVFNQNQGVQAVLTIIAPSNGFDRSLTGPTARALLEVSKRFSKSLGG
jgi:DNA-binding IclR family transcriptional regulator